MRALALALLLTSSAASAADKFDLVCTGTLHSMPSDAGEPWQDHFRFNLMTRQFCEGDCSAVHPIAEIQPGTIILEQSTREEDERGQLLLRAINRTTGEYRYMRGGRLGSIDLRSHCQPAPFSGFPKLETKF